MWLFAWFFLFHFIYFNSFSMSMTFPSPSHYIWCCCCFFAGTDRRWWERGICVMCFHFQGKKAYTWCQCKSEVYVSNPRVLRCVDGGPSHRVAWDEVSLSHSEHNDRVICTFSMKYLYTIGSSIPHTDENVIRSHCRVCRNWAEQRQQLWMPARWFMILPNFFSLLYVFVLHAVWSVQTVAVLK